MRNQYASISRGIQIDDDVLLDDGQETLTKRKPTQTQKDPSSLIQEFRVSQLQQNLLFEKQMRGIIEEHAKD